MSILSESIAEMNAKKLEIILLKGKEKNNSEISSFLRENVYPLYIDELKETFGAVKENQELRNYYFEK